MLINTKAMKTNYLWSARIIILFFNINIQSEFSAGILGFFLEKKILNVKNEVVRSTGIFKPVNV